MKTKTTVEYLVEWKSRKKWFLACVSNGIVNARKDVVHYKTRPRYPLSTLRIIRLTTITQVKREVVR